MFLIPAVGVTLAWYGYIATDVLPEVSLIEWSIVALLLVVVVELIVLRMTAVFAMVGLFVTLVAFIAGVPFYFFAVGFPVRVHGVVDHGGVVLGLLMVAAFSALWRLYRAGFTALDIMETTGNLPKGSLSKILNRNETES